MANLLPRRSAPSTLLPLLLALVLFCWPSLAIAQNLVAEQLYAWDFQRNDVNPSDQMPKGWKRVRDRQHPSFVVQKVVPRDPTTATAVMNSQNTLTQFWNIWNTGRLQGSFNPESVPAPVYRLLDVLVDRCVEIQMDGGSAEMYSPVVPIERGYSYSLDGMIQTVGLKGHEASIELQLLDRDLNVISSHGSEKLSGDNNWRNVNCVSSIDDDSNYRFGRVHFKVEKLPSRQLFGVARFDSLRINRIPRLQISSDLKHHSIQPGKPFTVFCDAIGITNENGEEQRVLFQILDHLQQVIREESIEFVRGERKGDETPKSPTNAGAQRYVSKSPPTRNNRYSGRATWNVRIDNPGFYAVRVYLGRQTDKMRNTELPIAVVDGSNIEGANPFGWTLPDSLSVEQMRGLPAIVRLFGAGRIKIPIWLDTVSDAARIDQLAWLIERLGAQGVQSVGIISQPPESQRENFNVEGDKLPIVSVLQDKRVWEPLLDPILSRMTMKLTWLQLGSDDDHSYVSNSTVADAILDVRKSLQVYAQDLSLSIAWPWMATLPTPSDKRLPWEATQFSIQPELTADELASYVTNPNSQTTTQWLTINPLPADQYSLLDRVRDLTERITMMRRLGVPAAYISKPLDPQVGLFDDQFQPQAIAVPWRTLIQHLASADYIGSNQLPGGSTNHFFVDSDKSVMLLWSDKEQTEQLFLGNKIDIIDLWGKQVKVEEAVSPSGQLEQKIHVGPWPIIVRSVDPDIARFRMQFQLGSTSLPSLIGRDQNVPIKVGNPFSESIRGKIDLYAPTLLQNGTASLPIILPPDRLLETNIPIQLRSDASAGKHRVRFDFQIDAKQDYSFSTYHELTLGFDDIDLQWSVQKETATTFLLRLEATNRGPKATTFECKLFPSPYPYKPFVAEDLVPGVTTREFVMRLPEVVDDAEYWIRCEELGSRRTLNYRVKVTNKAR